MKKKRNVSYVFVLYILTLTNTFNVYCKSLSEKGVNDYNLKRDFLVDNINSLPKNRIVPLVNDGVYFTALSVSTSINDWTGDGANVIDTDLFNKSTASNFLAGTNILSVTYASEDIPKGSFVGFRMKASSLLGILNNIVINIRDGDGNIVESYNPGNDSLSSTLDFSGPTNVGFITTQSFKTIEIVFQGTLSSLDVYYPFIKVYQENSTVEPCNEITAITNSSYPVEIDDVGLTGVNISLLGSTIKNPSFIIDTDENNYAVLNGGGIALGVLSSSYISIKKQADYTTGNVTPFLANTYAGFSITSSNILNFNVLGNITITTYLNDVFQEDNSVLNNLIDIPLLNSNTQNVGFVTSQVYDEIRITVSQPIGVSLGEIRVNYPIIKKYCVNTVLNCNEKVAWTNTGFPVEVSKTNSSGLVSLGGSVKNLNNIISTNTNDYAEIGLNIAVASIFEVGVYDVLQEYTVPHYVGFEIETSSLLDLDILNNTSVLTYLNGVATGDNVSGTNLLVSAPLLAGNNRKTIGFVTTAIFDEVRIQFNTTLGVNLGEVKIYNSTIQKMCSKTLSCSENYNLNSSEFSTYIDYSKTGVSGLVCVGCELTNTNAVISNNTSDFASINITAGIAANASIVVRDATNIFPANSYAGFVIRSNSSTVELSLFESIVIETLDENGNTIETASGNDLLDLTVLLKLVSSTPSGIYNLGFNTTQSFRGLKISVNKLIDVNTNLNLTENNDIDVFNAFVNTTGATGVGFQFCLDSDNDTVLDVVDLDDDNDGILDTEENNNINTILDDDNDGILNYQDPDTIGFIDTNSDNIDDRFDFDLDGIIDQHDNDSDGDGCPDALEAAGSFNLDDILNNNLGNNVNLTTGIPIVNGISGEQNTTNAVKNSLVKIACFIDLSLRTRVNSAIVKVNGIIIFSIKLSNKGGLTAKNVLVENILAVGLEYDEGQSTIPLNTSYDENTGVWDLTQIELKSGEQITLLLAAKVVGRGLLKMSKAEVLSFNSALADIDSSIKP